MRGFLYLILITFVAYGIGKFFLKFIIKELRYKLSDFVFSTGLGLALLGYLVYAIGSSGLLYQKYILATLFICALVAAYPFYKFISSISWNGIFNEISNLCRIEKFFLVILLSIFFICLFGAAAPEIGNDALAYHIYHPKVFIQNHKIGYIPFTRESLWPYLAEMLFTLGLIFKSIALTKMFHLLFGVLSALAVFSFTHRFFSRREALLATVLFYSAPGIFMQSVYAYVDLALCFYSFVALYALILWQQQKQFAFLILSAIFTGCAMSVKILGGFTLIALCAIILVMAIRKDASLKSIIKPLFIFTAVSFIFSAVWYIRSYVVLGNPVYPFMSEVFKSGWPTDIRKYMGTRRDVIGFFRLPWDLVIQLDSFGGEQIGVIFLAFLPLVLFVAFKKDVVWHLAIFLLVYTIIWFWMAPNIRFAFVNFAIVFVLIGAGFYQAIERYNFSLLKILLGLCLLFNTSLCLYYNREAIKLNLGIISKQDYLLSKERTFPVAEFVNRNLPLKSLLITVGEPRAFYFDRKQIQYSIWQEVSSEDIAVYIEKLHRDNIPVYLLCRDDADYQRFKPMIAAKSPIYEIAREVDEGKIATYRIFKL